MHNINSLLYEMEYHALSKMLKLVCALAIGEAPIHDVGVYFSMVEVQDTSCHLLGSWCWGDV